MFCFTQVFGFVTTTKPQSHWIRFVMEARLITVSTEPMSLSVNVEEDTGNVSTTHSALLRARSVMVPVIVPRIAPMKEAISAQTSGSARKVMSDERVSCSF